eukprot:1137150-Pelagomonas_calceolata.AAC.7
MECGVESVGEKIQHQHHQQGAPRGQPRGSVELPRLAHQLPIRGERLVGERLRGRDGAGRQGHTSTHRQGPPAGGQGPNLLRRCLLAAGILLGAGTAGDPSAAPGLLGNT